ncbi:MAG: DUF4838 domain-containing protein [Clostridia bacterium]|nr:DUF4838 domain-containing protein [Clostridia bacterium]
MMKKRILAVLLASISLISLFGCKNNNKGNNSEPSGVVKPTVTDTIHEFSMETTPYSLVKNGATEYKILVSEKGKITHAEAISELQLFFEEATDIKLTAVTGENTFDSNAKYISLGDTNFLQTADVSIDYATLGSQGYEIHTVGQSIVVCGAKQGVLYGVYELLYQLFDFETLSNKITYIETSVKDVPLPKFTIKEVPDIEFRIPVTGTQTNDADSRRRMRMLNSQEVIMAEGGQHNTLRYILKPEYMVDEAGNEVLVHPSWYSEDVTQLCYTARGNAEEYAAMLAAAAESVKRIILKYPSQDVIAISQMDVVSWCECDACQALEDKYGTDAVSQIYFINDLTDYLDEWLTTEEAVKDRDIQFMIFAYHMVEEAPAVQNEDGTWSPIDESVVLNDNVAVWIAALYEDYTLSVHHEDSYNIRRLMESWHACTNTYFIWAYNIYFDNYLIPYDSYGAIQDMIQYFVLHDTRYLWAQGNYNTHQNTGYDDLKSYLFSKLMWNCNLDVNTLTSNFFHKVYREAADIMEGTYWAWRMQSAKQIALGRSGSIYASPAAAKFWPQGYLTTQLDNMEAAKTAIEHYKISNPELYQAIYDSIVCETISPRFLLLENYSNTFSNMSFVDFKSAFKKDVNRLGFDRLSEHVTLEDYGN